VAAVHCSSTNENDGKEASRVPPRQTMPVDSAAVDVVRHGDVVGDSSALYQQQQQ
jgi:hypothetical protein